MLHPLYSYELSNADLAYFYALSYPGQTDKKIMANLNNSAMHGHRAIRLHAALLLLKKELKLKKFKNVSKVSINLLDDDFTEPVLLEYLLESYYLQKDYKNLISAVNIYIAKNTITSSPKIKYYNFLAKLHEKPNFAAKYFRELLLENPASQLILDAYTQIKKYRIDLPPPTTTLADFKIQILKGENRSASQSMMKILETQKELITNTLNSGYIIDNVILTPVILNEMYKVANATAKDLELLKFIKEFLILPLQLEYSLGEVYTYEFIGELYETAAYLERRKSNFKGAADLFMSGLPFVTEKKYEKMLWYWYNSLLRYSPTLAASQIELLTEKWTTPNYFSDVLSELATFFVQQGQWSVIQKLLNTIQFSGPDESISKYAYLTARAGMESYININKKEIVRLMTLSYESGFGIASGLYYRILAGNYLKIFDIRELPWMFNKSVLRNQLPMPVGMDGSVEIVFGWLKYGYYIEAYNYLMNNPFSDFYLVRKVASELSKSKNFVFSMRLLIKYSFLDGFNLNVNDLKLIYPNAYNSEILLVSEKEKLKWYIFTALVREESYFQRDVVSSAGAIGLSQLMPATAEDVADRLHISNYNLTNATTNLSFGAWYLGNLNRHTDILSDALFAYNAGLTRVRRWRDKYSNLTDDLFLEIIPFKETSHYGRKVLVSSVVYGYLYDNIDPNKIISLFFRN